jgi:hypothetical protein
MCILFEELRQRWVKRTDISNLYVSFQCTFVTMYKTQNSSGNGGNWIGEWKSHSTSLNTEATGKTFRLWRGSNLDRLVVQSAVRYYTDWATRLQLYFIHALNYTEMYINCEKYVHETLGGGGGQATKVRKPPVWLNTGARTAVQSNCKKLTEFCQLWPFTARSK